MNNITTWLDKIQQTCQEINLTYIDIIVDQCGIDYSIIPALSGFSPEIEWRSLYAGLPEDIYQEDAPLLVRIALNDDQQVHWLYDLADAVSATSPLLILASRWPFSALSAWLRQCVDANHEGREGIFRFWDTRIFSYIISDVLSPEQNQLLRPALFWSWLDRDGKPELLNGNGASPVKDLVCQQISLTDRQFETMMCLCDAGLYLLYEPLPENCFKTKEGEFAACFRAMLAATQERVLFDDKRREWITERILQESRA